MMRGTTHLVAGQLLIAFCTSSWAAPDRGLPVPPVAAKQPYQVPSPNGARRDDYYWLRDDTRKSAEVLGYLNQENAYRDAVMAPTDALQQKLYDELVGRIKPDDSTVPVHEHGYWYYTRFEPGLDYPVYCRRKGSIAAPEQVMLDGNQMAKSHEFFQIGATHSSPDGKLLAYTEDDVGRRQYTLKIKDLGTGQILSDAVTNVEPEFVWTGGRSD
jgi:oligopeptidase B